MARLWIGVWYGCRDQCRDPVYGHPVYRTRCMGWVHRTHCPYGLGIGIGVGITVWDGCSG